MKVKLFTCLLVKVSVSTLEKRRRGSETRIVVENSDFLL